MSISLDEVIFDQYISKIGNSSNKIGVELEFQIIDLDYKYEYTYCEEVVECLKKIGFSRLGNEQYKFKNNIGDVISYEYSFNCIEFSFSPSVYILEIKRRFISYFEPLQQLLMKHNCMMMGSGINPNIDYINQNAIPTQHYKVVEDFLKCKYPNYKRHNYAGFCSFISSCQTHIEVPKNRICQFLRQYYIISGLKGFLFSNSINYFDKSLPDYNCMRDYLWLRSNFGYYKENVGYYNKITSEQDIINDIKERTLYSVTKSNETYLIEPQKLKVIENNKEVYGLNINNLKHSTIKLDLNDLVEFRSYKMAELTRYGTVEIRDDCQQPLSDCFVSVALMTGINANLTEIFDFLDSIEEQIHDLFGDDKYKFREYAISNHMSIPQNFNDWLDKLVNLSIQGLKMRGFGEEVLLEPLLSREHLYCSPGQRIADRIRKASFGDHDIAKIITEICS